MTAFDSKKKKKKENWIIITATYNKLYAWKYAKYCPHILSFNPFKTSRISTLQVKQLKFEEIGHISTKSWSEGLTPKHYSGPTFDCPYGQSPKSRGNEEGDRKTHPYPQSE